MPDPSQTKHIHQQGTWTIPSNLHEEISLPTFENQVILNTRTTPIEYQQVRYCFRDMLRTEDPIPRPEGDWPSARLDNFLRIVVLGMLRNGLTKFQMAFPQTLETENSDSDWSASLNIPAEFRNDQSQEEPDAVILYREYNFQLTESNIPEVGRRISVSIRRINLPKKMGEIDFED